MPIQPLSLITVTVKVVFTAIWIQPKHIGMVFSVYAKPKLSAIDVHAVLSSAVSRKGSAVFQHTAIGVIKTQRIDDIIEFLPEILSFQILPKIKEAAVKLISAASHISAQMSDQPRLHGDLLALRITVIMFCPCHWSDSHIHQRSRSLFLCLSCCSLRYIFRSSSRPARSSKSCSAAMRSVR